MMTMPKDLEPLANEARKYKTYAEFKKALVEIRKKPEIWKKARGILRFKQFRTDDPIKTFYMQAIKGDGGQKKSQLATKSHLGVDRLSEA